MEIWSSGDRLEAWRRGSVEVWSSRVPEVRCRRVDVEVCVEVWSSGAPEVRRRRVDVEIWSSGALELRCKRVDVEM